MLAADLIGELHELQNKYTLHPELPSMRCVGYRQGWQYLAGEINETQFIETGIIATRQLAKRQLTWLRAMPENVEIDCLAQNLAAQVHNALRL
jgi:tRNA dimethylallyltransferase